MMKAISLAVDGSRADEIELPPIFSTPFRRDLIHKVYTNLNTHRFQPKGTHPTAGMDVSADSLDPPTGHARARVARINDGGGGRRGQAGEVASVRGGRQAHPPNVLKYIHKRVNKKENRLALCSAIAASASRDLVAGRGHKVDKIRDFPIIISDQIEEISKAKDMRSLLESLNLADDVERLRQRKRRTGKPALRGRTKKEGTSVLFVVNDTSRLARAAGGFPGVSVRAARDLSVLDLAPGADPARLTAYTRGAIKHLETIKSTHLSVMEGIQ